MESAEHCRYEDLYVFMSNTPVIYACHCSRVLGKFAAANGPSNFKPKGGCRVWVKACRV